MLTDWVLIHRLAVEIEERLRGARVDDAGLLADGRIGLLFRRRGQPLLLAIDPFASPPLVTLEEEELGIAAEPGFVRALARALRGMVLKAASSRRGDRLIRLRFAARSSFGVGEELDLYLELVPRYGNAVLVKGGTVVAALKEFGLAENPRRAVQAGAPYELPPLPARTTKIAGTEPANLDRVTEPLYVYRRGGELLAAYVTPLEGFDDARMSRESSLLQILRELRGRLAARLGNERGEARRRAILKRLAARERKARDELERLKEKRRSAELRDELRAQGEGIFATLHELHDADRDAAKERAGELFAQYKRLAKSVPHVDARRRAVAASLEAIEMLAWEAERAGDEDLEAVETAVAQLTDRRAGRAVAPAPKRRRKRSLLEFRTQHGSRIVVGRSPVENDELTFRLARPNDLWFHARGVPGAHVILAREDHAAAPDDDLRAAASLAAFHSRARAANSVEVDYAPRKHVRKRRAAPPGLVWYTQARTIAVPPKPLA
jgi:predicted ribosome quality control (RQC) complex YloA/Tae2 family protein